MLKLNAMLTPLIVVDGNDHALGEFGNDVLFGEGMPRWRIRAANDETANAWRVAA